MAYIDNTYFVREIKLPGNVLSGTLADIDTYIAQYERLVLIDLLGYSLYKNLIADTGLTQTRWSRLVNGHEYEIDYKGVTTTVQWNGLVNTNKISLLAYFVYYYYMKFHLTYSSERGELYAASENARGINAQEALVHAYNEGVFYYGMVSDDKINPTAYNFLYNFKDDATNGYDGWIFTTKGRINTFGL